MVNVNPAERRRKTPSGKSKLIRSRPAHASLRLTPPAWAKLLYLRDAGPTEVGGFGVSSADDLLLVHDVRLVRQQCGWASVELDDAAVADYFDEQVELGRTPEEFGRIWVHTHPGNSAEPSATDEETFARVFGGCDWTVMLILACGGASYARLRFRAGPGGELPLPVEIDYEGTFTGSDQAGWDAEYQRCVAAIERVALQGTAEADPWSQSARASGVPWYDDYYRDLEEDYVEFH